jgi:peptidoglycan LD-endopeptidase CwlK
MTYALGARSVSRLEGLHPDLRFIVFDAITHTTIDFTVTCGLRTPREQIELYAQGRTTADLRAKGILGTRGKPNMPKVTWTLNSLHFPQDSGYGHAVDLAPWVKGEIDWETGRDRKDWRYLPKINDALMRSARANNIPLEWGGDWKRPDGFHWQLPRDWKGRGV